MKYKVTIYIISIPKKKRKNTKKNQTKLLNVCLMEVIANTCIADYYTEWKRIFFLLLENAANLFYYFVAFLLRNIHANSCCTKNIPFFTSLFGINIFSARVRHRRYRKRFMRALCSHKHTVHLGGLIHPTIPVWVLGAHKRNAHNHDSGSRVRVSARSNLSARSEDCDVIAYECVRPRASREQPHFVSCT